MSQNTYREYKGWLNDEGVEIPYSTLRRYRQKHLAKFDDNIKQKDLHSFSKVSNRSSVLRNDALVNEDQTIETINSVLLFKTNTNDNISDYENDNLENEISVSDKEFPTSNFNDKIEYEKSLGIKLSIMSIYIDYRPSKSCMNAFIKMFKQFYEPKITPNFDSLLESFKNCNQFSLEYDSYFYCSCCSSFREGPVNPCPICKGEISTFYHLGITNQLKALLSNQNILDLSENTDTLSYKNISREQTNFLTLTINTDGMSVFKSSNLSIWPVYLTVNQIKKKYRFKLSNVIIAGIWVSKIKPTFSCFLKPIIEELKILEKGVIFQKKIFKIFLTNGIFDKPARAAVLNTVQYNGKFGCIKCYQPGVNITSKKGGTVHVYPYQNYHYDKPTRTHKKYLEDLKIACELSKNFKGIKGPSMLNELTYFYPIESTVIDYMHSVLEGVVRSLIKYLFCKEYSDRPYSLKKYFNSINQQLLSIKVPRFIPRSPRSLNDLPKWKANELFSFLIYFSLPLFRWVMPLDQLNHWINLVVGLEYLLSPSLDKNLLDNINLLFRDFVRDMESFYGKDSMLSGVHELIHIVRDIKVNGNINELSCFAFEDLNRQIGSFLKAKNLIGVQMINSISALKNYQLACDRIPEELKPQVFLWKNKMISELSYGKILNNF